MSCAQAQRHDRSPIAILGVPFDPVSKEDAVDSIEEMIASRRPHYLVTPNVDFLVQARRDVELRRILFEAHLVVCDGTPLVWASRLLGNPLPERVAGADLVPLLIEVAARKGYRIFLLGATPDSAERAVQNLRRNYPRLVIAGSYSPPFHHLLEMDHEEIKRRVLSARPDLLFVSFGCPKQEKWVAMHYRNLGVPVTAGVGATIDFLAGQVKRAPLWMQKSGTEWVFRLAQEPRRLFRRYVTDLWVFGASILPQWWELRGRALRGPSLGRGQPRAEVRGDPSSCRAVLPERLDVATLDANGSLGEELLRHAKDCVLDLSATRFIDSTGVGWLIRLRKKLRGAGLRLVLLAPTPAVVRALELMRLTEFFSIASDQAMVQGYLSETPDSAKATGTPTGSTLVWRGEITAANAEQIWEYTLPHLAENRPGQTKVIDLSQVRFIDSSGLGVMIRAKKRSLERQEQLCFINPQPPVRNVVKLSRLDAFLFGVGGTKLPEPSAHC